MKLHNSKVSQGIEYRLRTSDKNFCKCYSKYLSLNKRIIFKCSGYNQVVIVLHFQVAKEKQVWELEKPSTSREEIQTFPKILDKTCQMLVLQDKDTFGNTTLQLLQQRCDLALTSWNTKVTDFFSYRTLIAMDTFKSVLV